MSPPDDQWRPPEQQGPGRPPRPGGQPRPPARPKWMPWVIIALIVAILLFWKAAPGTGVERASIKYGDFLALVKQDKVDSINYDASNGKITGQFVKGFTQDGHSDFASQGQPNQLPDADIALLDQHQVSRNYKPRSTDWLATILVWVVPFALLGLIWWFIARRAQGQMGAVMNIGRWRAKVYHTDKRKTTFADVRRYAPLR